MGGNTVMDPRRGLEEEEEGGRERGRWAEEETGKQGGKCQEEMEGIRERWMNDHFHMHIIFKLSSTFWSILYICYLYIDIDILYLSIAINRSHSTDIYSILVLTWHWIQAYDIPKSEYWPDGKVNAACK